MKKLIFILIIITVGAFALDKYNIVKIPLIDQFTNNQKTVAQIDPEYFGKIAKEKNIKLNSDPGNYCLTCDLTFSDSKPLELAMNSSQLSSALQSLNNTKGPLKNIQISLGNNNNGHLEADLNLSDYGIKLKPHIKVDGSFTFTKNSIHFNLENAKAGPLPVKPEYLKRGEEELNKIVAKQIDKMPDLSIEELSVKNGIGKYKGNFPHQISSK